jgi:dihydroorotase
VAAPGFLDMHVHFREPGYEHKETLETGIRAAANGGFTAVCTMPNTNPAVDHEALVRWIIEQSKALSNGIVDIYPVAAITKAREGKELAPMLELAEAGAVGFSDDGAPVGNSEIMRRALEYASMTGSPIIQHAEESCLTKGGVMNEGFVSTSLGMQPIPPIAEEIVIARDLKLAEYTSAPYHVAHISTKGSVQLIRNAKKNNLKVTCEVTPHHFTLTDEIVRTFNTNTKMNPPLRSQEDVEAVKEGLKDGTIDVIATDHAPHSFDEKQVEFLFAPFGIVGLETAVGLALNELLHAKILTLSQIIEKFSINPRKILHLPLVKIAEGEKANITIFDPNMEWIVDIEKFKSKSKNSPFQSKKLKGKPLAVFNSNQLIYSTL